MTEKANNGVPSLREVIVAAEKRLAGLRKSAEERRIWLANNVPDLNFKLMTPATRMQFVTKLCAAVEAQPLEVTPISAEQVVQNLREQLEELQELVQYKEGEYKDVNLEIQETKQKTELLVRLRKLRQTEGEMRLDEQLTMKLRAVNHKFKSQRKWLQSTITNFYGNDDEMNDLLRDLTAAYYSDGNPYINAVTDGSKISSFLTALIACGIVSRHPYDVDRVRLQDMS